MSRSKGTVKAPPEAEIKNRRRSLFKNKAGDARTGWLLLLSLAIYALVANLLNLTLSVGFARLFAAWNVRADNAWRTPGWARALYAWQGSLRTVIVSAALLGMACWLRKLWKLPKTDRSFDWRCLLKALLPGMLLPFVAYTLFLLSDSLRLEWPLSAPNLSASIPLLVLLTLLRLTAEEFFSKGVLLDGVKRRWGMPLAWGISALWFLFANSMGNVNLLSWLNLLLMGLLCGLIYEKSGILASIGVRFGWAFVNQVLFGFGNTNQTAVYKLYAVSEISLSGGDGGLIYGIAATFLLILWIAGLSRREIRDSWNRLLKNRLRLK